MHAIERTGGAEPLVELSISAGTGSQEPFRRVLRISLMSPSGTFPVAGSSGLCIAALPMSTVALYVLT